MSEILGASEALEALEIALEDSTPPEVILRKLAEVTDVLSSGEVVHCSGHLSKETLTDVILSNLEENWLVLENLFINGSFEVRTATIGVLLACSEALRCSAGWIKDASTSGTCMVAASGSAVGADIVRENAMGVSGGVASPDSDFSGPPRRNGHLVMPTFRQAFLNVVLQRPSLFAATGIGRCLSSSRILRVTRTGAGG